MNHPQYKPIRLHPDVSVDVSLVVPDGVAAHAVQQCIMAHAGPLLQSVAICNEFRTCTMRAVTWRLTFRDPEDSRTLQMAEVNACKERIVSHVRALGVWMPVTSVSP